MIAGNIGPNNSLDKAQITAGEIRPVIDRTFALDDIVDHTGASTWGTSAAT